MGISVNEAGHRGGFACLHNKGRAFYVEIGKKGQVAMRQKYPSMASEWGKMGGRPQKQKFDETGRQHSR